MKKIEAAFVLAAGKGERLRPLTLETPKPLLKVRGRPILEHVLRSLEPLGLKRVVVNSWYLGEQIESYVNSSRDRFAFKLLLSKEEELLGTGGGLKQALQYLEAESFWMLNGDCLWKGDLLGAEKSRTEGKEAHWLLLKAQPNQTPIGVTKAHISRIGALWDSQQVAAS